MASLQKKGNGWYCQFLHDGRRRTFAVGRVSEAEAEAKAAQVDYLLMRLRQGYEQLPSGVDVVEFLRRDGKPRAEAPTATPEALTLARLRDRYMSTHEASLEPRTLDGIRLHFKHLLAVLGDRFPIAKLALPELQGYVDRRAKAKGARGARSPRPPSARSW